MENNSLPAWLVSSLVKIKADHPALCEILRAAVKLDTDSRAYRSAAFHRFRLLMQRREQDRVRRELDEVLKGAATKWPRSSLNLLLGARLKLAADFDEFLRFSARTPAGIGTSEAEGLGHDSKRNQPRFHLDSAWVFNNYLSARGLLNAVNRHSLPDPLNVKVALAGWVRAVMLDEESIALELAAWLERRMPELREAWRSYQSEKTPASRKFAAVFLILKAPGLRPWIEPGLGREDPVTQLNIFRDNWWCPTQHWLYLDRNELRDPLQSLYPGGRAAAPEFLSKAEVEQASKERERLDGMNTAPNYLCREVVQWVRRNPSDARGAEALHLAVNSTRRGCGIEETGRFSREAFRLLHRLYPDGPWAKKTKYWYGQLGG